MLITSSILLDSFLLLTPFLILFYLYTKEINKHWEKRGVYNPPTTPFFGNFLDIVLMRKSITDWIKDVYDQIDKDFYGVFIFTQPFLVIKDPSLVKHVLIRDFNNFTDRSSATPSHCEIQSNMMFFQKSPTWKTDRGKVSVIFTSKKLKSMYHLMATCGDELQMYLKNHKGPLDAKLLCQSFAIEAVARCAFGINAKSFNPQESLFTDHGKKMVELNFRNGIRQMSFLLKPNWVDMFKINIVPKDSMDYFIKSFWDSLNFRTKEDRRDDLIDIIRDLQEAEEFKSDGSDDGRIGGLALVFFLGGYETTSSTLSFALYELLMNPEIQEKARKEINNVLAKHGEFSYDAFMEMPYLDMCINETLRMYPVFPFLERRCNEQYQLPETDFFIEKGTSILIPVYALQNDEKYWYEPNKFIPERFENKLEHSTGLVYLPFGTGPRNCIGERFARLSAKICLASILRTFEITACSGTPKTIIFNPKSPLSNSKTPLHLEFTPLS